MLAGPSAARALGWDLPDGSWPVEAYVPEPSLVDVVERYALEPDPAGDLVLRSVPEPWPFPPQLRVVPELVAARRPRRRAGAGPGRARACAPGRAQRRSRPVVAAALAAPASGSAPDSDRAGCLDRARACRWSPPATTSGTIAPSAMRAAWWRCCSWPAARCAAPSWPKRCTARRRASAVPATFSGASPPHGLVLLEHADQLQLVTAPDVGKLVEAFLHVDPPEALSQAALEVLAIVAYEQPVSRADVAHIRGTDSAGVIDTLLARGLIADDARFGGRGRPAFLVTTDRFLQVMGIGSLAELPPRPSAP